MRPAAGDTARALPQRIGHQFFDLGQRCRMDQRALRHLGLHAVADLQLRHSAAELFGEQLVDAVLHQQAVGADAGLPGVAELRGDRAGHGRIEIGIIEHDERCVAAEFERQPLERRRTLRGE